MSQWCFPYIGIDVAEKKSKAILKHPDLWTRDRLKALSIRQTRVLWLKLYLTNIEYLFTTSYNRI